MKHRWRISAGSGRRLQRFLKEMEERLRRGEELSAIVSSQRGGVPRMAAAALGAGLQSGRPGLAVEMMGDYCAGRAGAAFAGAASGSVSAVGGGHGFSALAACGAWLSAELL
ncbi:MAG UNVERIFIED_CONTAM: hypothetical protein LVR18_08080 [Planctomycetaceae bacterium]